MNNNKEIFKDIPGYEDRYQVSNFGRVKSLVKHKKGILLSLNIGDGGYCSVTLCKNGKHKQIRVNRLVGQSFLGLDINNLKMLVCHIDDVKTNNNVDNLFIGTHKENTHDMITKGRKAVTRAILGKFGKLHHGSKKVKQYTKEGKLVKVWNAVMDVERELGFANSNICKVCNGGRLTAYNFIWKYN